MGRLIPLAGQRDAGRRQGRWTFIIAPLRGIALLVMLAACAGPAGGAGHPCHAAAEANSASAESACRLRPRDSIQAAVDAMPEGAAFLLEPGVYRGQSVEPKPGQRFFGAADVVLNGAVVLSDWRREGDLWVADDPPAPLVGTGKCKKSAPLCRHREDLFIDGVLLVRVASPEDVGPGSWTYDDGRALVADDPRNRLVELSATERAFGGEADDVVLSGLVVEKYATDAQQAAIDAGDAAGWQVIDVVARHNHGIGVHIGDDAVIRGGSYSYNGQMGMGGEGDNVLVEGVEVAHNNYAGYNYTWEAGGLKFVRSTGLTMRGSCVHHNAGPGIWSDIDNIHVLFADNLVFENDGIGIQHEISYDAVIRDNVVIRNGLNGRDRWLWASGILLQNAGNTAVLGNTVEVDAGAGNGITLIHQDRGEGRHGPYLTTGNRVEGNTVTHLGRRGVNGFAADDDLHLLREGGNVFDRNAYIVPDAAYDFWAFHDADLSWPELAALGIERGGSMTVERRTPTNVSCPGRSGGNQ